MSPATWSELDRRDRRREIIGAAVAVAGAWALLLGIYYLIPFTDMTSGQSVVRLVLGIVAFAVVFAWQLHRVRNADFPGLGAVQALGGAIPLFLVAFAASRSPIPLPATSVSRSTTLVLCTWSSPSSRPWALAISPGG